MNKLEELRARRPHVANAMEQAFDRLSEAVWYTGGTLEKSACQTLRELAELLDKPLPDWVQRG